MDKGFQLLDKELAQIFPMKENMQSSRFIDKLVQVASPNPPEADSVRLRREGATKWVLIHIEVQGYNDKDFGRRMFTYFYRIFDVYGKPVTAFAIFTDNGKEYHPKTY